MDKRDVVTFTDYFSDKAVKKTETDTANIIKAPCMQGFRRISGRCRRIF